MRTPQLVSLSYILALGSPALMATPLGEQPDSGSIISAADAQSQANGLLEDQSLSASITQYYAQDHASKNTYYSVIKDNGRYTEYKRRNEIWVQGNILDYTSGYSTGVLGVAFEAAGYNEVALARGHGRIAGGGDRTLRDSNGDAIGQWSKLGVANLKLRLRNTVLTLGRQTMASPGIASNTTTRALPSGFSGASLRSNELNHLTLELASFDRVLPKTEQSSAPFFSAYGVKTVSSDRLNMAGFSYHDGIDGLKVYRTNLKDFWNQDYLALTHTSFLSPALNVQSAVGYYHTGQEGSAKLGNIDNNAYSLGFTLNYKGHSLLASWQQILGNEPLDYVNESYGSLLGNTSKADFNGPHEKSVKLAYTLDHARDGIPGLKSILYVTHGWDIDGTHYHGSGYQSVLTEDSEHHKEYGVLVSYVVQSGRFANSMGLVNYLVHSASENHPAGNFAELRLLLRMPFKLL